MKCPVCVENDQISKVWSIGQMTTLMSCHPYYDEDGVYHSHDQNKVARGYLCSNNHRWSVTSVAECPNCDFGKNSEKIKIYDR